MIVMDEQNVKDVFEDYKESGLESNPDFEMIPPPRPLFQGRKPAYVLKAERPEHRAVIMMKAAGLSNVEIAATLGKSAVHVATVVKQPWAQQQILEEIENAGREPVVTLLQGAAADAAQKLIMLCQEGNTHEIQRKASVDILNRVFGMPNQAIEHTVMGNLDEKSDAELMEIVSKHRN
jgi:hypothetical protein